MSWSALRNSVGRSRRRLLEGLKLVDFGPWAGRGPSARGLARCMR